MIAGMLKRVHLLNKSTSNCPISVGGKLMWKYIDWVTLSL